MLKLVAGITELGSWQELPTAKDWEVPSDLEELEYLGEEGKDLEEEKRDLVEEVTEAGRRSYEEEMEKLGYHPERRRKNRLVFLLFSFLQ